MIGNQRSEEVFILLQFFSFQIKKKKKHLTDKAHQSLRGPGSDIIRVLSALIKLLARSQISNDLLRFSKARVFLLQYIHLQSENKQPHTSYWELESVAITTQLLLQLSLHSNQRRGANVPLRISIFLSSLLIPVIKPFLNYFIKQLTIVLIQSEITQISYH